MYILASSSSSRHMWPVNDCAINLTDKILSAIPLELKYLGVVLCSKISTKRILLDYCCMQKGKLNSLNMDGFKCAIKIICFPTIGFG